MAAGGNRCAATRMHTVGRSRPIAGQAAHRANASARSAAWLAPTAEARRRDSAKHTRLRTRSVARPPAFPMRCGAQARRGARPRSCTATGISVSSVGAPRRRRGPSIDVDDLGAAIRRGTWPARPGSGRLGSYPTTTGPSSWSRTATPTDRPYQPATLGRCSSLSRAQPSYKRPRIIPTTSCC